MLSVGETIQAKLIEEIEENHWIVSFQGQLLQVRNTAPIQFKPGLQLKLQVVSTNPTQLQVLSRAARRSLDILV